MRRRTDTEYWTSGRRYGSSAAVWTGRRGRRRWSRVGTFWQRASRDVQTASSPPVQYDAFPQKQRQWTAPIQAWHAQCSEVILPDDAKVGYGEEGVRSYLSIVNSEQAINMTRTNIDFRSVFVGKRDLTRRAGRMWKHNIFSKLSKLSVDFASSLHRLR